VAPPTILHVDLDAFFAAVEQRDDPALRGKPVLVGGSARRGVVAAASYEARTYGVFSAMPMAEALRRCPHAIVVPHRMERYAEASRGFFAILDDFSPAVEGLSFDEAFVDLTGSERLLGPPRAVGRGDQGAGAARAGAGGVGRHRADQDGGEDRLGHRQARRAARGRARRRSRRSWRRCRWAGCSASARSPGGAARAGLLSRSATSPATPRRALVARLGPTTGR
jgi:nucleotidyltransferase/DNA polymerase involved in DNA repair